MRNLFILLTFYSATAYASTGCDTDYLPFSPDSVLVFDEIPSEYVLKISKSDRLKVFKRRSEVFVFSRYDSKWHGVQFRDWSSDELKVQLQILKIQGVPDPLIYLKWNDASRGSGMGEVLSGKILLSFSLKVVYLNIIDRSTHYWHDKYGDNATYKTFNYHHMCLTKINSEGFEVTYNNTCGEKFKISGDGESASYLEVAKLAEGKYKFEGGRWRIQL